jgi:hypothetical protein
VAVFGVQRKAGNSRWSLLVNRDHAPHI